MNHGWGADVVELLRMLGPSSAVNRICTMASKVNNPYGCSTVYSHGCVALHGWFANAAWRKAWSPNALICMFLNACSCTGFETQHVTLRCEMP